MKLLHAVVPVRGRRGLLPVATSGRLGGWGLLLTTLVWLLVGWSVTYWALRVWNRSPVQAVPVLAEPASVVDPAAVARALGVRGAPTPDAAPAMAVIVRHTLVGLATAPDGQGVALLAEQGQPAQAVRVGGQLPDGWRLLRLEADEAVLAPPGAEGPQERLTLPEAAMR